MSAPHRRFRAPQRDRELLAEPPFAVVPELIERNRQLLATDRVRIDGLPLRDLRQLARREVLGVSHDHPLIVTGHQPELFHPGVWVKNFAAFGLARRVRGVPLNLVVDNDTVKATDIKLPAWEAWEPPAVRLASCAFAEVSGEPTWETLTVEEAQLESFREKVSAITRNWGDQPLLAEAVSRMKGRTLGKRFVAARQSFERAWGCELAEVTVSQLSRTEAFRHFARHLLADHDRFRAAYNAAVQAYRRQHGLRSRTHPVPDLAENESPFWSVVENRRQKATPTSSPDHLRPRALTLTLFARLCLGDFFIHGIGGGKYDEVTDRIIRDYFGLEPPAFQVHSATLHLPLPTFASTPDDLKQAERLVRDLQWNPQRYLPADQDHAQLLAESPTDRAGRRRHYREFRVLVEKLRPNVANRLRDAEVNLTRVRAEVAANAILQRRDFSWVLYPEFLLRPFMQDVMERARTVL